ncbi:MAG: flagellar hook basal-body protein [Vampirovibrionales bacterium]
MMMMMMDPFITAINTARAARAWYDNTATNLGNIYTPGFRQQPVQFTDFLQGVMMNDLPRSNDQGKSHPGKGPTNLMVEGDGWFVIRNKEGKLRYTRTGDFKFNGEGFLVNEKGDKVQGYLLDESGKVLNTGDSFKSPVANLPNQAKGGPGHIPTTDINLWVDPTNGKFFGKYEEFKVRSDGTVIGIAKDGKESTPLYRIALANFVNPGAMAQVDDLQFVPTELSGEPMEGTGEVRSGLVEMSNVSLKDQVETLTQAKTLMNFSTKLIQTNKTLLEEALRLIQ